MRPLLSTRPLLVTEEPALLDHVLRCAAEAGVLLEVAPALPAASWAEAPLVLVGDDALARYEGGAAAPLPRRGGIVLLGEDLDDAEVWSRALLLGAEHVVFLPDADAWLIDLLAEAAGDEDRATVVGVVGGCGGAGATTVSTALALAGVRQGWRTLLLDLDPSGGGIDLAAGTEAEPGERWSGALAAPGPAPRRSLPLGGLPRLGDLTVLSWDEETPDSVPVEAALSVLGSARRRCDLVVADLARAPDPAWRATATSCAPLFVVVPARLRACAAARRVVRLAEEYSGDVRLLVRRVSAGLDPGFVSDALGLPVSGVVAVERELARDEARGLAPGRRLRGPLSTLATALLDDLDLGGADEVA